MNSLDSFAKFIPASSGGATASPLPLTPTATTELDFKTKRFTNGLNDSLYELSNEPSLGLYRIQEHVRKNMPSMLQKSGEMNKFQSDAKGHIFDLEYSIEAVNKINKADPYLDSIKQMLTDSMYAARQIKLKSKPSNTSPTSNNNNSSTLLTANTTTTTTPTTTSRVKDIKSSVSNFSITNVLSSTRSIRTSSISIYENLNNKLSSGSKTTTTTTNSGQSSQKDDQN